MKKKEKPERRGSKLKKQNDTNEKESEFRTKLQRHG
jgi:hypothetical protein